MLCENCGKNQASVILSEVIDKKKEQKHLCEQCSKSHSLYIENPAFSYSMQSLIGQFLETITTRLAEEEPLKCEKCGTSYQEFRRRGRFGCPHDYQAFRKVLDKLLEHIHGANQHKGKIPATHEKMMAEKQMAMKIQNLKRNLQQAIDEERYEDAANLRDQIKLLEGHENDQ